MTVKESFDLPGTPTCWGFPQYKDNIAQKPAVAVQRLLDAGAVVFGKTNVPVALGDWQSFNPVYGTTNNPWDLSRTPGGSSGGASAALAAGMTPLELGSDIGASIRNPAHYCGVYGHKPTWGVVPMHGHQLPGVRCIDSLDIAVAGPLARSAQDLQLAMQVLTTPRSADPPTITGFPCREGFFSTSTLTKKESRSKWAMCRCCSLMMKKAYSFLFLKNGYCGLTNWLGLAGFPIHQCKLRGRCNQG
jgi:Asp-tRNA(Asn)/Glu-tRNA(Gln) amidotransferase A subunit family amidase